MNANTGVDIPYNFICISELIRWSFTHLPVAIHVVVNNISSSATR